MNKAKKAILPALPLAAGVSAQAPVSDNGLVTRDAIDRALLAHLQANARESVTMLAKKCGVARTTVLARIERMEKSGLITGYSVRLNAQAMERSLQSYVGISVAPRAGRDVVKRLGAMPEIKLLCSVSGEFDYVAWIRADSANVLDGLLDEIGEMDGVIKTTTSIVLAERINRG